MDRAHTAARILDERARSARHERERRAAEVRERVRRTLQHGLPAGADAWIIGSLAWGGFGPHSDVDIVVRGVASDALLELERALGQVTPAAFDLLELDALPAPFRERVVTEGLHVHGA